MSRSQLVSSTRLKKVATVTTILSEFEMLRADERRLARDLQLLEFFGKNSNYLMFIEEIRKIVERRFQRDVQSSWTREKFVSLTTAFLEHSEPLFDHVSGKFVTMNNPRDISPEEWERVCVIGAKILVSIGWKHESNE